MAHVRTLVGKIAFAANVDVSSYVSKETEACNSQMAHFQNAYSTPGHYDIIGSSTLMETVAYGPSHIPGDERTIGRTVHRQGISSDIHRRVVRKPSSLVGSCTGKKKEAARIAAPKYKQSKKRKATTMAVALEDILCIFFRNPKNFIPLRTRSKNANIAPLSQELRHGLLRIYMPSTSSSSVKPPFHVPGTYKTYDAVSWMFCTLVHALKYIIYIAYQYFDIVTHRY
jgi:hypothetical protein